MTRPWTAVYEAARTSRKLARLPDDSCRLFYFQLLLVVDSYGCIEADPLGLDAKVWPALKRTEEETSRVVNELWRMGLVEVHGDATRVWLRLPDWDEKAGSHLRRRGVPEYDSGRDTLRKFGTTPGLVQESPGVDWMTPDYSRREKERETEKKSEREKDEKEMERESAGKPRPTRKKPVVDSVTMEELPEKLRTDAFAQVMGEFIAFRREKGSPVTPIALRNLLLKLEPHGAAHAAASLRDSMANGWTGVFPEKRASGSPSPLQPKPGSMREWFAQQDADAARGIIREL